MPQAAKADSTAAPASQALLSKGIKIEFEDAIQELDHFIGRFRTLREYVLQRTHDFYDIDFLKYIMVHLDQDACRALRRLEAVKDGKLSDEACEKAKLAGGQADAQ